MSSRPHTSLIHFAVYYFVQGAVQAYLSGFQKPHLVDAQISLDKIAWLSAVMVFPFWIKILFGWISDRFLLFGDHRKSYMLVGLSTAATCYASLALIEPQTQFTQFFVLIVLSAFGMALFDTCADGLAIDQSQINQEGQAQAAMGLGRGLGFIVFSFVFGQMAMQLGYAWVFLTLASILFGVALFVWRKTPRQIQKQATHRATSSRPWHTYWRSNKRDFLFLSLFSILYSIPSFGVDGLVSLWAKQKLSLAPDQLGHLSSVQGLGAILGALLCAMALKRFHYQTTAYLAVALLSLGAWSIPAMASPSGALWLGALWSLTWCFQETLILSLCMRASHGPLAATLFALFMMFSNIGTSAGEWLGVNLYNLWGGEPVFYFMALSNLILWPYLYLYFRKSEHRVHVP